MKRRRLGGWMAMLVAVFLLFQVFFVLQASRATLTVRGGPPNILLVTADLVRRDHLSCYNPRSGKTPTIDALAARGVLFENAYVQSELTHSSHMSIFTSRYPSELYRGERFATLAEMLSQRGYHTAALPSTAVLNPEERSDIGFLNFGLGFAETFPVSGPGRSAPYIKRLGKDTNALATQWLSAHASDPRPWFLFLNYRECHPPIILPADHWPAQVPPFDPQLIAENPDATWKPEVFAAAVSYVDFLLGQVLDHLQATGQAENTAVVFLSDHGWNGWAKRPDGAFYDPCVHVPLIVSLPGGPRGKRVSAVVQSIDVVPTLLSEVLRETPQGVSGRSLLAEKRSKFAFAQTSGLEAFMVTDGRWKYVEFARGFDRPGFFRPAGYRELFDLQGDPAEKHNLARRDSEKVRLLRYVLARTFPDFDNGATVIDAKLQERLKKLDYF